MSDTASTIRVRFFKEPVENPVLTLAEGRPIFEEVEMVELVIPGDRLTRHVALADEFVNNRGSQSERYKDRYPVQYAAFKAGDDAPVKGTPLDAWPLVTRARAMELKAIGITTVDELAAVGDHIVKRIGIDGRNLREQAQAFINQAKGGAELAAQASRIAELEAKLERLAAAPVAAPPVAEKPAVEKDATEASNEELKAYIKKVTGEAPRGNISRETLLARVEEIAMSQDQPEAA